MKKVKIAAILTSVVLCLGVFMGCGKKDDSPLTLFIGKNSITYGMAKEDVEKIFDTEPEKGMPWWYDYSEDLSVGYRDDKVCGWQLSGNEENADYKTNIGIAIGDDYDSVKEKLGDKIAFDENGYIEIRATLDDKGNYVYVSTLESFKDVSDEELKNIFDVSIQFDDNKVENIMALDMLYGARFK